MDRTRLILAAALVVVVTAVPVAAAPGKADVDAPIRFEIEGYTWAAQEPAGNALVSGGAIGTPVDLRSDLGLGSSSNPTVRGSFHFGGNNRLRIAATRLRFDGERALTRNVQFGDLYMRSGSVASTELSQDCFQIEWIAQFMDWGEGTVKLGPTFGVYAWNGDLRVSQKVAGGTVSASKGVNRVTPSFGLAMDIVPHRVVDVYMTFAGMHSGAKGWFFDGEAGVKVYPIRSLGIVASYRRFDVHLEERAGSDLVAWSARGPFLGVNVRF